MDEFVEQDRMKATTYIYKYKNRARTIHAHIIFCGKEECERKECCLKCKEMLSYIEFSGSGIGDASVFFKL